MHRVLVLGGYGVFGRRAVERLAREAGLEVIVAGRSASAAERMARETADKPGCRAHIGHAVLDAFRLTDADLARHGIGTVINTVGPFQTHDYRVAEAAIGARAHYIDIADARGFVAGIGALDQRAKEAGVLVVSGASSVPALAAAVVDHYQGRFGRLSHLKYGISPGNSFDPGVATTASILGGAGQPFTTLVRGRMKDVRGWHPLDLYRFRDPAAGTRWLGHCDVPDLDLFPARYPDLETQHFVAGVEVKAFHLGLWAMAWLVRAGIVRDPGRLAGPLLSAKNRLRFLGSDVGAMFAVMSGHDRHGRALRITWELIAGDGCGPYIPITPAVIIAKRLAAGGLAARGAMPCLGLMTLDDFTDEVRDLAIRHDASEAASLYRLALGTVFDRLPAQVRALHEVAAESVWCGTADVERGQTLLARLAYRIAGLPPAGQAVPLTVTFTTDGDTETWRRDFAGRTFTSRQSLTGSGAILEQVGPARLQLRPEASAEGLNLALEGMRVLGVPVPRALHPTVATREHEAGGRTLMSRAISSGQEG